MFSKIQYFFTDVVYQVFVEWGQHRAEQAKKHGFPQYY